MSDIELVIKVPEELYKASRIINAKHDDVVQIPLEVIKNAIQLPKGHGKIKDVDRFIDKAIADRIHSCYSTSWTADDVLLRLKDEYAPTIIEADK